MAVLVLFAFLAGIVTILSPCILPILPVVLSGGIGGAKAKPLGVASGFIAAFTVFTLTLTKIVRATGVSADTIRYFAVGVIIIFGLLMIVPRLHEWYASVSGRIANPLQNRKSRSADRPHPQPGFPEYTGGFITGLGLGLVWTPCVGPIMASVISLALTEKADSGSVLITLAYSIGTAIPMLGIMFGGRSLIHRIPALLRNTERIQRVFGVLVVLTGIALGFGWDRRLQAAILQAVPEYGSGLTAIENIKPVKEALELRDNRIENGLNPAATAMNAAGNRLLRDYGPAPEIVTKGRWYNTENPAAGRTASSEAGSPPLTMSMLRGKVVIIDFWTYSCVNCVRTLPHLAAWYKAYAGDGLVIIGVHTPEFEFEKNAANVKKAIADLGVTWPVVLDNNYRQWNAYSNRYWPAHYFIDVNGRIRYRHFGEGEYDKSEQVIKALLGEAGSSLVESSVPQQTIESWTPETYLGYGRARKFSSKEPPVLDRAARYTSPRTLHSGEWSLSGNWKVAKEYVIPEGKGSLHLRFNAKNVFLVIEPETGDGRIQVALDGAPAGDTPDVRKGMLLPDESRLYQLVALDAPGSHTLRLEVNGKLRLFAFTFG